MINRFINRNKIPKGVGMTHLRGSKMRYFRDEYWKLPAEKQDEVKKQAERYYTACDQEGVEADAEFFNEIIPDIREGNWK